MRTNLIKNNSRHIIEKYYPRLTLDFSTNKRVIDEVCVVPSKRIRNKLAGFVTVRHPSLLRDVRRWNLTRRST